MAEVRERYYSAACQYLAAAAGYLARLAPLSPQPFMAPHPVPALQLPHLDPLPRDRPPHRRRRRRAPIQEVDDDDESEEEDVVVDEIVHNILPDPGGSEEIDDVDDFAFALQDLLHLVYPTVTAAPPYPVYSRLSDEALQRPGRAWFMFGNGVAFTIAVTICSLLVFRSSRRFVPTLLRAVLLGVTVGAEIAAAVHLLPRSRLSMILSYVAIFLHFAVFILATVAVCRPRRRLHPLP